MNKLYRLHTKWPQRKARVSREKKDLVFLIDPFQCWFIQHQLVSSSSIQNYKPHSVLKSNKLVYSCIHFLAPRQNPGTNAFRHLFQCLPVMQILLALITSLRWILALEQG